MIKQSGASLALGLSRVKLVTDHSRNDERGTQGREDAKVTLEKGDRRYRIASLEIQHIFLATNLPNDNLRLIEEEKHFRAMLSGLG